MTTELITTCDRCGKEIKNSDGDCIYVKGLSTFSSAYITCEFCNECSVEIKSYLRQKKYSQEITSQEASDKKRKLRLW